MERGSGWGEGGGMVLDPDYRETTGDYTLKSVPRGPASYRNLKRITVLLDPGPPPRYARAVGRGLELR